MRQSATPPGSLGVSEPFRGDGRQSESQSRHTPTVRTASATYARQVSRSRVAHPDTWGAVARTLDARAVAVPHSCCQSARTLPRSTPTGISSDSPGESHNSRITVQLRRCNPRIWIYSTRSKSRTRSCLARLRWSVSPPSPGRWTGWRTPTPGSGSCRCSSPPGCGRRSTSAGSSRRARTYSSPSTSSGSRRGWPRSGRGSTSARRTPASPTTGTRCSGGPRCWPLR